MKFVLLGYMASGKTSVGKALAKALKMPFIDLDNFIEEKESMPVSTIFKEKGEIYFRKVEHYYLEEILSSKKGFILALGGGTPCYYKNMEVLNKITTTIYLKASINTLHQRLLQEKSTRPLIAHLKDSILTEFIAKHLFERTLYYQQAKINVNVNDKDVKQITSEVIKFLR